MRNFASAHPVIAGLLGLCAASCLSPAMADEGSVELLEPTRAALRLTTETLALPGQDTMNWAGGDLLFDVGRHLRLGFGSYGAMAGRHGGFITLGAAAQLQQRIGAGWRQHIGLFVGAGGGNSVPTLAGDGLMWRGELGLSYETGFGHFGLGLSHVRFPTGEIDSTQPYLQYEYPFFTLLGRAPGVATATGQTGAVAGFELKSQELALILRHYRVPASVLRVDGLPQHGLMQLLGVQWESAWDDHWFVRLEAEGAMGGQSSGYMQIFGGGGYRWRLTRDASLKLHAGAGPAGGGGVDTDGGLLLDAGLAWQQRLSPRASVELGVGEVRSPSGSFQAHSLALKLSHHFGLPVVAAGAPLAMASLRDLDVLNLRIRLAQQNYRGLNPQWRRSYVDRDVGNLGLQLDHFVSPGFYLSGQGLAAATGNAGAYMTGQLGMGAHWPLSDRWFVEGEGLLGAAGGGGLATGSGLVLQANANLGYRLTPSFSLLFTRGRIRAVDEGFDADVSGFALAYRFTSFVGK